MPTAGWWEALWPDPAGVLAKAGMKPGMEVIDLCSGDGWFTLQIAKVARHVVAIDIDANLLEVARHRLTESNITNCDFVAGDAYDLTRLWPLQGAQMHTRAAEVQAALSRRAFPHATWLHWRRQPARSDVPAPVWAGSGG